MNVDQGYEIQTAITPNVSALFKTTINAGSPISFSGAFATIKKPNMVTLECDQGNFCIAPTTGTYYFKVQAGQGFAVGSRFHIDTTPTSVQLNSPRSTSIAIYQKAIFSFTGAAGDVISTQKFGLDIKDIYKSDGTGLSCTVFCKLPVSGTYYLVAQNNSIPQTYRVLISKAEAYTIDTTYVFPSETDFNSFHRFYAAAGQRLTLASSKTATVYSIPNTGWDYRSICTTSNSSATCTFTDAGYYYVSVGNNGSTIPSGTTFSLTAV